MRSLALTDNRDILTGLRMAGIEGVLCGNEESLRDEFHRALANDKVGLIVLTTKGFYALEEEVIDVKMHRASPLIVTIPEIDGQMDQDFILKYIQESIGIGMKDDAKEWFILKRKSPSLMRWCI